MRLSVIIAVLFSLFMVPSIGFAGGQPEDPSPVQVDPKTPADLTAAKITNLTPLVVRPGSLVCISGSGFGAIPGTVSLAGSPVLEVLSWDDETIFFRVPKLGINGASEVSVGEARAPAPLTPAPSGSITIRWAVSLEAFDKSMLTSAGTYGAVGAPTFTPPLYLKGEWLKTGATYGNAAKGNNWDNQSKVKMMAGKGGKAWIYELVLTPDNQASFGNREMRFGFADAGSPGTLSKDESDYAFILGKEWGKNDLYTTISEPALIPGPKEKTHTAETGITLITYPKK